MTSAQMTSNSPKGFTLLELVIVMGLVALFLGSAVSLMPRNTPTEVMALDSELRMFIRDTRDIARSEQRTYYIHFSQKHIWRDTWQEPEFDAKYDHIALPKDTKTILTTENDSLTISKSRGHSWLFSRSGLIEPLTVRMTIDGSSFEYEFNELSALPVSDHED